MKSFFFFNVLFAIKYKQMDRWIPCLNFNFLTLSITVNVRYFLLESQSYTRIWKFLIPGIVDRSPNSKSILG